MEHFEIEGLKNLPLRERQERLRAEFQPNEERRKVKLARANYQFEGGVFVEEVAAEVLFKESAVG